MGEEQGMAGRFPERKRGARATQSDAVAPTTCALRRLSVHRRVIVPRFSDAQESCLQGGASNCLFGRPQRRLLRS